MESDGNKIIDKIAHASIWFVLGLSLSLVVFLNHNEKLEAQIQDRQYLTQNLLNQNNRLRWQLERDIEIIMDTEEKREMIRQKFIKLVEGRTYP